IGRSHSLDSAKKINATTYQLEEAHESVVREARSALERGKDAILVFLSGGDQAQLTAALKSFAEVRGGLQVIGIPQAAIVMAATELFLREKLLANKAQFTENTVNLFAWALMSVEYFLERLLE